MVPRCHNNNNNNSDDDDDDDDDDYHDDGDESEHRELLNDHIRSLLGPDSTSTTTSRSGPSTAPSHNPTPATPPSMNFSDNAGRKNAGRKNAASADGVKQAPVGSIQPIKKRDKKSCNNFYPTVKSSSG